MDPTATLEVKTPTAAAPAVRKAPPPHSELALLIGKLQAESRQRPRQAEETWSTAELVEGAVASLALAYLVAIFARDLAHFLA